MIFVRTSKIFFLGICMALLLSLAGCKEWFQKEEQEDIKIPEEQVPVMEDLNAAILENPEDPELYFLRAQELYYSGVPEAALQDMYQAMLYDSINPKYLFLTGDIMLEMGQGVKAIMLMQNGTVYHPEEPEFYLRAAEYNMYMNNHQGALDYLNACLKNVDVHNADAYFLKGYVFKESGDTSKAISNFQTAAEQDPTYYDAYMQTGLLYSKQKNPLAVQYFENALRVDPKSREAMYAKAYHYQYTTDFVAAIKEYKNLVKEIPQDEEGFYNIGFCYLELDSLKKAYEHFKLATQIAPEYAEAYYMKGHCSEIVDDKVDALKNYEQALKLSPGNEVILEAIKRIK